MLQANTLEFCKPERHIMPVYRARLTVEQHKKIKTVAAILGCTGAQALRAMIDAVTVDGTPTADYPASYEDVDRELE